jgi:pyruvate,water dikinase
MRDDYRRPFYFAMIPFWNEVARRTKLSFVETNHLLPDELKLAIKNPGKKWQILAQERIKNFAFELSNGKFYIHTDPEAIDKLLAQVRQGENKEEISGQAAYHGKTKGLVRIIYKKQDFHKFHEGDVLVTPMTHTEFLPLMKKASAIITDEGGVTCHAAIVAREMKKPCIIGTKIATKILKDGDLVEVDADKGIVKILK